jgi:hypothetical protein
MTNTNTAQMVADLSATNDEVRGMSWVAPGLGVPGSPLGLLTSTLNPLATLVTAGLGWFAPMVSFLGEPLTQLQGGNSASVSSGSQSFDEAGKNLDGVAGAFKGAISAETTGWSGTAASDYRATATQQAGGLSGLGQASTTTGSAIIGAGQVVAQAIAEVTEIISEAVGEIVPIMTQAMARQGPPPADPGAVAEAIPPCVGIAATAAAKCLAKLAALIASGDNLMKLVQGAMGIVDLIKSALSSISQQSVRRDAEPAPSTAADQRQSDQRPDNLEAQNFVNPAAAGDSPSGGSSAPSSSAGGSGGGLGGFGGLGGGVSSPAGASTPNVPSVSSLRDATHSNAMLPPSHTSMPDGSRVPGHAGGVPTGGAPVGGVPAEATGLGLGGGARTGALRGGADSTHQNGRPQPARPSTSGGSGGGAPGGMPMAGGARAAGGQDKDHQRKYEVTQDHDETFQVPPLVIGVAKTTED